MWIYNTFQRTISFYSRQSNGVKTGITVCCMLFLFWAFYIIATYQVRAKAGEFIEPLAKSDLVISNYMKQYQPPSFISENKWKVYKMQMEVMQDRKQHHLSVAIYYLRNYYATSLMLILLSCAGAIILFTLVSRGWKEAGLTLRSMFYSLVFGAFFFGFFPVVFKQEDNMNNNLATFVALTQLQLNMTNQLSVISKPDFARNSVVPLPASILDTMKVYRFVDSTIAYNTDRINQLTNFGLSIDASKIKSINEVYKMMTEMKPAMSIDSTK